MALQKNLTLDNGINLPEAYIRITSIVYVNNYHVTIKVSIYKDKIARNANKSEVVKFQHLCIDDFFTYFSDDVLKENGNSLTNKGYEWIKTLDFYKDAIDITDTKE
jgi:hypothetical protein